MAAALERLRAGYDERGAGIELRQAAGGVRLYTRPSVAPHVERFLQDGQRSRLSQAALETLAVIAYRQPVTRSRVSAIRGVNVDGVVRTLLSRGLIVEIGTEAESGARTVPHLGVVPGADGDAVTRRAAVPCPAAARPVRPGTRRTLK